MAVEMIGGPRLCEPLLVHFKGIIGIDLLKFQCSSYSGVDKIDMGVYIVTTRAFQKPMKGLKQNWDGSLTYEKVQWYLPFFKSAIQVPIYVAGIDVV